MGRWLLAAAVTAALALPTWTRAQAVIGGEWRGHVERTAQRIVDVGLTPGVGVAPPASASTA